MRSIKKIQKLLKLCLEDDCLIKLLVKKEDLELKSEENLNVDYKLEIMDI